MYIKKLELGERIGTRTVIEELKERKNGYVRYVVKCDCGDVSTVSGSYLRLKEPPCKSCSLRKNNKKGKDHYAYKHGMASRTKGKDRIYSIWVAMRQRCNDPNDQQYKNYGGRGIRVCEEWNEFSNFIKDMGERPQGTQLDRINNDGNYCKNNCKWSDRITQANNRTTTVFYEIEGKKVSQTSLYRDLKWTRDKFRHYKETHGIEKIIDLYKNT